MYAISLPPCMYTVIKVICYVVLEISKKTIMKYKKTTQVPIVLRAVCSSFMFLKIQDCVLTCTYSYFEKGCPAKLYATKLKAITGNGVHGL